MKLGRRDAIGLAAGMAGIGAAPVAAVGVDRVAADLSRYIAFGVKAAGGPGDQAAADWIAGELEGQGFAVARHAIDVPAFAPATVRIALDGVDLPVLPAGIPVVTADAGVAAPLTLMTPHGGPAGPLAGAIALIELPHDRWSSARTPAILRPVEAAVAAGAVAAILVTTGPTGEAIALNADARQPIAPCPVVAIGPRAARPLFDAARRRGTARVTLTGVVSRRSATNLVARIDRGRGRWLVVSTPRSGWTACAGERGPGIAAFLALARIATGGWRDHDLMFLCNSGHEYENAGAEHALAEAAPPPERTDFWLHLGANLAARDWHEAGPAGLLPLPSPDPQRFLAIADAWVPLARRLFADHVGLAAAYPLSAGAAGELGTVAAAGYRRLAGIFGAHRFHHVATDDARCVDAAHVAALLPALRRLIDAALPA